MLIFLFGKDIFRAQEKVREIKEKFLSQDSSGGSLSVLDYEEKADLASFKEAFTASGMFSAKRLVIVKNLIQQAAPETQKSILGLLEKNQGLTQDKDLVLVFQEKGEPRKNNALFKFLFTKAKKQVFNQLEGKQLQDWISEQLAKTAPGSQLDRAALSLLEAFVGNDLASLEMELAKLASYRPTGIINKDDVLLLVKSQASMTIFDTIEALAGGNKQRALELLHQQLAQGADAFYLLSMYAYQFRNLLKIGDAYWNGNTNNYAIAKEVGLHPFVVQKGVAQLRNFTPAKLKMIYGELQKIDQEAKTGKANLVLALDTFIASL